MPSTHLDIRNGDGTLMTFISTALPDKIRSMLEHNLLASMEDLEVVQEKDTEQPSDADKRFRALHMSWYNRHCTQVSKRTVFLRAGCDCEEFFLFHRGMMRQLRFSLGCWRKLTGLGLIMHRRSLTYQRR
jgi:hypothetical protein